MHPYREPRPVPPTPWSARVRYALRRLRTPALVVIIAAGSTLGSLLALARFELAMERSEIGHYGGPPPLLASAAAFVMRTPKHCPTSMDLPDPVDALDPWEHAWVIECDKNGVSVRSAGSDGEFGTGDDIRDRYRGGPLDGGVSN